MVHTALHSRVLMMAAAIALSGGCANYGGGLVPGVARYDDVIMAMGRPALEWRDADGAMQMAYPRGPQGYATYMVFLAPDGTLRRIENVLDERHFAAVVPGQSDRAATLRLFGPPRKKLEYDRRNEEAWEWRFEDTWREPTQFVVAFDRSTGLVTGTQQVREFTSGRMQHMR
jgi:hypothetical protein